MKILAPVPSQFMVHVTRESWPVALFLNVDITCDSCIYIIHTGVGKIIRQKIVMMNIDGGISYQWCSMLYCKE